MSNVHSSAFPRPLISYFEAVTPSMMAFGNEASRKLRLDEVTRVERQHCAFLSRDTRQLSLPYRLLKQIYKKHQNGCVKAKKKVLIRQAQWCKPTIPENVANGSHLCTNHIHHSQFLKFQTKPK